MSRNGISLILFLALTVGGGLGIGLMTLPGDWYAALVKPEFNPPNWLFGPVWSILYVLIGIAGWRIYLREASGTAMKLWWAALALNFVWSPSFFSLHQTGLALAIILALLAVILGFIVKARFLDRPASLIFAPYAAWVGFASLLNASIFLLN